jgi:hypothetical protein
MTGECQWKRNIRIRNFRGYGCADYGMGRFKHINKYVKLLVVLMSNFLRVVPALIPGILIFVFLFWRRLKEDYSNEILFSSALSIVFYVLVLSVLVQFIFSYIDWGNEVFEASGVWFWGSVVGYLIGLYFAIRKFELRKYEVIEASAVSLLPLYSLVFISWAVYPLNFLNFAGGIVVAALFALFVWLERNYKKVPLLKFSKSGAAGLFVLGTLFFMRSVVAAVDPSMVSFAGRIDVIPSAVVSFLLFFFMYNLSEL